MKTAKNRWITLAALAFVAITIVAWKKSDSPRAVYRYSPGYEYLGDSDTTPARKKSYSYKRDYKLSEIDEAMKEVDRAMAELDKTLKVDLTKMNREIESAMEQIKNINFGKINDEVRTALKEVDWESVKSDVKRANKEVEKELKNIDKESFRVELDAAKLGDVINSSVALGLKAAKFGINKAKQELRLLKEFTDELERDKLINKNETFKIEIKDHEMFINGKKQSKEVNDKYRKYFKDRKYTLRSDGDDDDDDDESK